MSSRHEPGSLRAARIAILAVMGTVLCGALSGAGGGAARDVPDPTTVLWYAHPAEKWENALPVGNGRLGAMVFGKTDEERIQLNEETLWSGGPYSTTVKGGYKALPEIQKLVFEGKWRAGPQAVRPEPDGLPGRADEIPVAGRPHPPVPGRGGGDGLPARARSRRRPSSTVSYAQGRRPIRPRGLLEPGRSGHRRPADAPTSRGASPSRPSCGACRNEAHSNYGTEYFRMDGLRRRRARPDRAGRPTTSASRASSATRPGCKAVPEGGTMRVDEEDLFVEDADAVTLYVAAATNFVSYKDVSGDPNARVESVLKAIEGKVLRRRSGRPTSGSTGRLFRRVGRSPSPAPNSRSSDRRAPEGVRRGQRSRAGGARASSSAAISSSRRRGRAHSRPTSRASGTSIESVLGFQVHDQHQYRDELLAGRGRRTSSEFTEPLVRMIRELTDQGSRGRPGALRRARLGLPPEHRPLARGRAHGRRLLGHVHDGRRLAVHPSLGALPLHGGQGVPEGQSIPVMKGSVEFFLDFLVEHPERGWLVTNPSTSPENFPAGPARRRSSTRSTPGSARGP